MSRSSSARSATSLGSADRFAADNGTTPIEWSSANPKCPVRRLSRRGNRTLNHAIHITAVTQLRHRHSPGRGYYDRKRSQGQTGREALRSLKRRLSDVIYRHLVADAARRGQPAREGNSGSDSTGLSSSANLVSNDTNGVADGFVRAYPTPGVRSVTRPRCHVVHQRQSPLPATGLRPHPRSASRAPASPSRR
jgi:transposase